ncbi:GntR family transcriptional regulator [Alkalicoccus chagannorensis]|uniref:GntR family transcriptional regulator n=1 Tax=Alkalicoccus chagannorensis TaxID=427072 RepID=UPI0003F61CF8|nr:GntR family transcriptional regulator [Alkalicoccus chagannorensis]
MIDKASPIPIYYQLQEHMRQMIDTGVWKPGEPVPSERDLSEQHEISRMTIRQAMTNLVNEGLLTRVKGRGTFVAEPKIEQPLMKLTGFSEDMRRRGIEPGSNLLQFDIVEASADASKHLEIEPGTDIYRISRLRLGDGAPMAHELSYLRKEGLRLTEEELQGSLYEAVETQLGMKMAGARQTIEPSFATEEEASLLTIEAGAPVLLLERVSRLESGAPIEYVKSIYRGDRYKFIADLER